MPDVTMSFGTSFDLRYCLCKINETVLYGYEHHLHVHSDVIYTLKMLVERFEHVEYTVLFNSYKWTNGHVLSIWKQAYVFLST